MERERERERGPRAGPFTRAPKWKLPQNFRKEGVVGRKNLVSDELKISGTSF